MKNTDKDGKPIPRVEKYIRKDGTPVHREYHRADDIPLPTRDEAEEGHLKAILKLTPKRDLAQLEKHFKTGTKSPKTQKSVKPFPQYLNIPDKNKEDFAQELKKEFCNAESIDIRYMIEGLINSKVLEIEYRQNQKLFNALKIYLNRNIGTYNSIFVMPEIDKENTKKLTEYVYHNNRIKDAELRINPILKKLHIKVK